MKVKITFGRINGLIPVMQKLMQASLPYDISFSLYRIGKTMDEANDYFVKHFKEIQESESETKDNDIQKLAETQIELNVDKINSEAFYKAVKEADISVKPAEFMILEPILDEECEEGGFSIIG